MIKGKNTLIVLILFLLVVKVKAQTIVVGQHECNDGYKYYNPILIIPIYTPYYLDINQDGIDDFLCRRRLDGSPSHVTEFTTIEPLVANQIAYDRTDSTYNANCSPNPPAWSYALIPKVFNIGDTVNSSLVWRSNVFTLANASTFFGCSYNFQGITGSNRFIGFRIITVNDTLYGWMKLSSVGPYTFEIEEIACESKDTSPPVITKSINDTTLLCGSNLKYKVGASSVSCLNYQWTKNGIDITGATSDSLFFNSISLGDSGNYVCKIYNPFDTVYATSKLSIYIQPPNILLDTIVDCGSNFIYKVYYTPVSCVGFQWTKDGIDINGATLDSLCFNPISAADSGTYTCKIYNPFDTIIRVSKLIVHRPSLPVAPSALIEQGDKTLCEGGITYFTVQPGIGNIISYQWLKDGVPVFGANTHEIYFSILTANDAGKYSCKLSIQLTRHCPDSNYVVEVVTNEVALNVIPKLNLVITQSGNQLVSNYQSGNMWYLVKDNQGYFLGSEQSIVIPEDGVYDVFVSNDCFSSEVVLQAFFKFAVNPNPFENEITVTLDSKNRDVSWELVDDLGITVLKGKMYSAINTINTSTIAKGHYYLKINGQVMKMIKY